MVGEDRPLRILRVVSVTPVEALRVDGEPVRDDLGRGQDFFECPGGNGAL